jgi:tRNA1(Val) A37 N6-methylase TrmN6
MFRDSFYTPKILADKLVSFIKKDTFQTVADFCIGDGELLRAAVERWPRIKCFGSDISEEAINLTQEQHKGWRLSLLDFLDGNARHDAKIFKKQSKYDLILLNPPFSCIGGTVNEVEFDRETYQVSTAMKFLVTSLKYMKPNGMLYAILPKSIAYSQKDKSLWNALEKKHNLSILEEPKVQYFKGCTPNVILISINDFSQSSRQRPFPRMSLDFEALSIFRGKLSMNLVVESLNGDYLVHSTNITANGINGLGVKVERPLSRISGPAVLIARVGNPSSPKICVIESTDSYVISDCIIAIKTNTLQDAKRLYQYMFDNWELVKEMYTGTGAPYITIEKLKKFLNLDIFEHNLQSRKAI